MSVHLDSWRTENKMAMLGERNEVIDIKVMKVIV